MQEVCQNTREVRQNTREFRQNTREVSQNMREVSQNMREVNQFTCHFIPARLESMAQVLPTFINRVELQPGFSINCNHKLSLLATATKNLSRVQPQPLVLHVFILKYNHKHIYYQVNS